VKRAETVGPAVPSGPHTRSNARDGAIGTSRPTLGKVGPAVPSGPHTRSNARDGAIGTSRPTLGKVGSAVPSGPHTRSNVRGGAIGTSRPTLGKVGPDVPSGPRARGKRVRQQNLELSNSGKDLHSGSSPLPGFLSSKFTMLAAARDGAIGTSRPTAVEGRPSRQPCSRSLFLWLMFTLTSAALAATNATDEIPPLRPPRGEIPATFWEAHGWQVAGAGFAFAALLVILWRLLSRDRPMPVVPPEVAAHHSLEALRGRPEDAALLSVVSRSVRGYFVAALGLPQPEPTNRELAGLLQADKRVGTQLAAATGEFLARCEHRQFAPQPVPGNLGAVDQALKLVDEAAARQRALAAPPQEPVIGSSDSVPSQPPPASGKPPTP